MYPNSLGLHDVFGNVAEWCSDEYADSYYEKSMPINPIGSLQNKGIKVYRGGGWKHAEMYCSPTSRLSLSKELRLKTVGFRVAITTY